MPIINKGIFTTGSAYLRQVGNDWPTAQVISTSDIIENSANLYFTTARVASNVTTLLKSFQGSGLTIDAANGQINITASSGGGNANVANTVISLAGHTTTEINEGSNLYYTDARVNVAVRPILTTANVIETSSNLYFTYARANAALWPSLTTANVIETSGNLYFTNARVVSALIAGDNIGIESNGRISATAVYTGVIVSDSIRIQSSGNATYPMGVSVTDPRRILVSVEGILQIPTVDYTVSGTDITFDTAISTGSNIEIKTFGQEYVNLSTTAALTSKVDSFIGNSASAVYTLSLTPPSKDYISVVLNGNTLPFAAYSLSGKTVTLNTAPPTGANLDIRSIAGRSGSVFNTRKYTGNGISNTFIISAGFNNDTILVFENGISQFPITDYNVVNDSVVFVTPPAANVGIQIRELGVPLAVTAANTLPAIRGYDQITGNLTPADPTKNLGNATVRWNTVYANSINISNSTIGVSSVGALTLTTSGITSTVATVGDSANYPHPFLLSLL